jgi:pimeloyl-ACP methyl ester carboxylesterase
MFLLPLLVTASFSAWGVSEQYCQRISDRAKRSNIKVMVIGVEGLGQMDAGAVSTLYSYSEAKKAGQNPNIPTGQYRPGPIPLGQAGITRGFMIPLMRNYGARVEPVVFDQATITRGGSSAAEACAQIWMAVPGRKLVIAGHSYGGPAAIDLAHNLRNDGVRVDALYSIDSVDRLGQPQASNPGNVNYLANYRVGGVYMPFARDFVLSAGHMNIPGHPAILADAERQIAGYIRTAPPTRTATNARPGQNRPAYRIGIDFPPRPTVTATR